MRKVDEAIDMYLSDLKKYKRGLRVYSGLGLHLSPVGDNPYHIATITGFDEAGMKNEKAVPFTDFIATVNGVERILRDFRRPDGFTGYLVGYSPSDVVSSFLRHKKVHRLFFIHSGDVGDFVSCIVAAGLKIVVMTH